jgi:hypothetical protein
MHFGTKQYPLDCPTPAWEALKEAQATDRNINDEIVFAIAKHVRAADVDLSTRQQGVIEDILEEERDERD